MAGGYSLDEVLKKDAYNYVNKSTRVRIDDGNANSTIVLTVAIGLTIILTTLLDSIEEFFTSVYTRAFFVDVKKEIEVVSLVNFVRVRWSLTTKVHTVEQYGHPRRHVVVLRDKNMGRLECDCYFCDTRKFSCKHMFFMMKHKHFMKVPEWLVLKRWTKHAKCLDDYVEKPSNDGDWGFLLRHGICILRPIGCSFLGIQ
ncbi:hypothetical protein Ahy_A01g001833 [Arachis hypogaea]|uniref:SWIM-type domain-containing protein n=1 Tax=Arachis hypogaea TaxID=3818 RepID=A0A445EPJ8_ARAHY|nr:hypothetical protein Ahy_A01g001833 [Arachis hypogaea]